jgi:hypothetical protein
MMIDDTYNKALIFVKRPSVIYEYMYRKVPSRNMIKLTGKKTRMGE